MSTEKQLRNKITLITFCCSLFVIWIHTYNCDTYGITQETSGFSHIVYSIESYWSRLITIAVPMFFFISGFLFFRNFSINCFIQKYKSRFKSIVIPYLCWCTVYYFYYILVTNIPVLNNLMNGNEVIVLSVKNWVSWLWVDSYFTLWFLKNLIIFILICPLLYFVLRNWFHIPTGGVVILLVIINSFMNWVPLPSGLEYYAFGTWIALNYKELALYRNKKISLISCCYIAFQLITAFRWSNTIAVTVLILAIWFALDLFEYRKEFPWWMKLTFFVYVVHDIFLEAFEKIVLLLLGRKPIYAMLDYILMPIFVYFILIIISMLCKKFIPHIWKVLNGAR